MKDELRELFTNHVSAIKALQDLNQKCDDKMKGYRAEMSKLESDNTGLTSDTTSHRLTLLKLEDLCASEEESKREAQAQLAGFKEKNEQFEDSLQEAAATSLDLEARMTRLRDLLLSS